MIFVRTEKTYGGDIWNCVVMNKQEALRTIESLSRQLSEGNCNSGRYEAKLDNTERTEYFTITVMGENNGTQ